jgi:hypothetical protein
MQKLILVASLTMPIIGCGKWEGVKVGDDEAREERDRIEKASHHTAPDQALLVLDGADARGENAIVTTDASTFDVKFTYDAPADQRLSIAIEETMAVRCGGAVSTKFVWHEKPADASASGTDLEVLPTVAFPALAGKSYELRMSLETSFGRCARLGLRFRVTRLP